MRCLDLHPQRMKTLPSFSSDLCPSSSRCPCPHPWTFSSVKSQPPSASTSLVPPHPSSLLRLSAAFPPPSPSLSTCDPSRPPFPSPSSSSPPSLGPHRRLSSFFPCCQAASYPPCSCSSFYQQDSCSCSFSLLLDSCFYCAFWVEDSCSFSLEVSCSFFALCPCFGFCFSAEEVSCSYSSFSTPHDFCFFGNRDCDSSCEDLPDSCFSFSNPRDSDFSSSSPSPCSSFFQQVFHPPRRHRNPLPYDNSAWPSHFPLFASALHPPSPPSHPSPLSHLHCHFLWLDEDFRPHSFPSHWSQPWAPCFHPCHSLTWATLASPSSSLDFCFSSAHHSCFDDVSHGFGCDVSSPCFSTYSSLHCPPSQPLHPSDRPTCAAALPSGRPPQTGL